MILIHVGAIAHWHSTPVAEWIWGYFAYCVFDAVEHKDTDAAKKIQQKSYIPRKDNVKHFTVNSAYKELIGTTKMCFL